MGGCTDEWADRFIDSEMGRVMGRRADGWTNRWMMGSWEDGLMEGWKVGGMESWKDGCPVE